MIDDCSKISNIEELIAKVTSNELDQINIECLGSDVPKKCLEETCILGVDEAGRGPVLGPMVYAVCFCPVTEIEVVKNIGCADSKALTEKKREEIFGLINEKKNELGWVADVISPNFISNNMQKRVKYSLNEIAQNSTIKLIKGIIRKNVKISEIYVDTIGPPEKYQDSPRLSTGSLALDKHLSGGLPVKGIIEICGVSGSGKSQLCMQLALTVQYPESCGGLGGGVIYICSEEHFPSKRLYQMIRKFPEIFHKEEKKKEIEFTNNIFILHVTDFENLENNFDKIEFLVKTKNIRLLVLDSIAALFRGSSPSCGGGRQKAKDLRTIAKHFYKLSGEYNVMIVCVNQVSESLSVEKTLVPALGLAWANLVTVRIQLKRSNDLRRLEAKLSNLFPQCKVVVEKKADSSYPIVGAASICAKVIRDTVVQKWKFPELIAVPDDMGTGYPGDPKTKQFLLENKDDVFGFPHLVRFSWSTAQKLLENNTPVEWEDEEDKIGSDNRDISMFFKKLEPPREPKHTSRFSFFKERSLNNLQCL